MTNGETFRPQGCYENIENGKIFIECVVTSNDSNNVPKQTVYRRNTPTSYDKRESNVPSSDVEDNLIEIELFGPENKPDNYLDRNKPYIKKKYPKFNKPLFNEFRKYENANWPGQEECKKYVSR